MESEKKDILIIPDVHGRTFWKSAFEKYEQLLKENKMHCVFLGDYVEGGDQNLNVLRWLMEQNKNEKKEHLKKALAALEISNAALKFYKKLFKTYD